MSKKEYLWRQLRSDKNNSAVRSFVRTFFAGPAYSGPSAETVERSNALAQERGGELVGVCECVRDVQGEEG